jgi:hypothetical protein
MGICATFVQGQSNRANERMTRSIHVLASGMEPAAAVPQKRLPSTLQISFNRCSDGFALLAERFKRPRGCDISPISSPFHPTFFALTASFSIKATKLGLP